MLVFDLICSTPLEVRLLARRVDSQSEESSPSANTNFRMNRTLSRMASWDFLVS